MGSAGHAGNSAMMRTLPLLLIFCVAGSCQQSNVLPSEEVHIGIQLRQLDGDPIDDLTAKDFRVSASNRTLPLTLARPSVKRANLYPVLTRLLVIFPPSTMQNRDDLVSQTIAQLKPVWSKGWQIALLTPEGELTPYVSSEQRLRQAVHRTTITHDTYGEAIDTLKAFAGRRLVIVMSDGRNGTLYGLRKAAQGAQAMLYDVGGNIFDNYSYGEAEKGSTPSLPAYGAGGYGASAGPVSGGFIVVNNTETWSSAAQLSIDDVHAERSFHAAVKDAIIDARNYYDLGVEVEVGTTSLTLGISVHEPYRITAQAYTKTSRPAPNLVLLQQKH
jgi:hypothetical protein